MRHAVLRCVLSLLAVLVVERAGADDVKEVAAFTTNGVPVHHLAFSADGARLAAALAQAVAGERKRVKILPGEVLVWDVAAQRQVCSCKDPKAAFTHVWLSNDGKVLVTANRGYGSVDGAGSLVKLTVDTRVGRSRGWDPHRGLLVRNVGGQASPPGYQAWDAITGKPIGSAITPPKGGEFAATALSPDGRFLATVYNETIFQKAVPARAFPVGEVVVWDLQASRAQWKLPAVKHTGAITWDDSLAFSPDGTRLVHYRSGPGGPSSEAAGAPPDRRELAYRKLRLLTLEAGANVPAMKALENLPRKEYGIVEWLSGGKFLVIRNGRHLDALDPATGQSKATLAMPIPQRRPAPPRGKALPPPPPPPDFTGSNDLPRNWYEPQGLLCARGVRMAAHFVHERPDRRLRENFVTLWDVPHRKVLGSVRLADEPYGVGPFGNRPAGYSALVRFTALRIALSGDGTRLAVSDLQGNVRLYDVSKISGVVKVSPAEGSPR